MSYSDDDFEDYDDDFEEEASPVKKAESKPSVVGSGSPSKKQSKGQQQLRQIQIQVLQQ